MSYTNMCPECKSRDLNSKVVIKGFLGRLNWWILLVITLGFVRTYEHFITEKECKKCGLKWR